MLLPLLPAPLLCWLLLPLLALGLVGNTPLVRVRIFEDELPDVEIYAKVESFNPGGSLKDRPVMGMLLHALEDGRLDGERTVLDSSSGNAGIAYAWIGKVLGVPVKMVIPDNASVERQKRILAHGATIHFTDAALGYDEALREVSRRAEAEPERYYFCDQYKNDFNWTAHFETTGREILDQVEGPLSHFVAGVGTGGTITGVGSVLKKEVPNVRLVAVEPQRSPVLSGGRAALHGIQGIGAGFVPDILDRDLIDEIVQIADEEAFHYARRLAREEGLLLGPSSGANVAASLQVAAALGPDARLVTVLCDTGFRYFSVDGFVGAADSAQQ
mgnify:CR=1 FL=1